ncbi:glycosyltransferase [Cupriavidus taiwanensis]|uniref:glycosyltransferase n=1 Tax=Cupriavidus taiwanensis TaxID=164546 RepID=UPI000E109CFE|nr:glycosyltransferase [Cupriavidus taiwanensis]SOY56877.1 conserved hypothetical protein [Cupriavidus taiwanensis]SOY90822.1 conserved hypothetical protein [Cupriavidus taiwanensis]SOZ63613.1 conserved hypothetical protein [Cupriavidus taiwanensis]SOZ82627.1 conserved hypothetical protein [Cupriavidus taiwanensis]SOZ84463.1 conserved hypothetical protein [Cupriavidus taiwanensis]
MRVKDLVRETVWLPGATYDASIKPRVSVLLPTFRRGKSGLFRRCVESLLSQTLEDLELIIIDDASTDGTADQIAEFQERDGRVSCLRHTKNIGLPAISEYEGFLRARADRFAFAFDDTSFNKDALEKLVEESEKTPHAMIYGHIEWSYKEPKTGEIVTMRLGSNRSQGLLRTGNAIPNNGVLLPRKIIEDVGFYDPHAIIARVCDWDLWCRVAERYEIRFVDVAVGREDGPLTNDSLGNTYALDSWAVSEWMRSPRNEQLKPDNLGEYEVLAGDPSFSLNTQAVIESTAKKHATPRGWPLPVRYGNANEEGCILVVTLHYDASTYLCFDMLPHEVARRIRVITYNSWFGVEEMARATCVIFVRHINAFRSWVDAGKALGVPMYLYMDDNLPLLVEQGEMTVPYEDYRLVKFREDVRLFDGVLLTSRALVSYFEENLLHKNPFYFPVSFAAQNPVSVDHVEPKIKGEVTIVFAGGSHRARGLWEIVVPALKRLAEEGAMIHLVAPESDALHYEDATKTLPDNLRITSLPFETGYLFAMRRFARFQPDFMVHAPSDTKNNAYKTLHPMVAARLLDTVAVVPDGQPYDQITEFGNAVVVTDALKPISWYRTFNALLGGKFNLTEIKDRNKKFCADSFSGSDNVISIRNMMSRHGGETSWAEQARRLHGLAAWFRQTTGLPSIEESAAPIDNQAAQLSEYRRMMRYSWRHRILRKSTDLWEAVSPNFYLLKKSSEKNGWRRAGSSLELSDSLHETTYREYVITPPAGKLEAVLFALSVDAVQRGQIGVEIITPDNEIKDHRVLDLKLLKLDEPVRFELSNVHIKNGESWAIRLFVKSTTPVYVYEFINRKWLGMKFLQPTPFMQLAYEK